MPRCLLFITLTLPGIGCHQRPASLAPEVGSRAPAESTVVDASPVNPWRNGGHFRARPPVAFSIYGVGLDSSSGRTLQGSYPGRVVGMVVLPWTESRGGIDTVWISARPDAYLIRWRSRPSTDNRDFGWVPSLNAGTYLDWTWEHLPGERTFDEASCRKGNDLILVAIVKEGRTRMATYLCDRPKWLSALRQKTTRLIEESIAFDSLARRVIP